MESDDKKFFEDLAKGQFINLEPDESDSPAPFEPELVKATTVRSRKTKEPIIQEKEEELDDFFEKAEGELTVDVYQTDDEIIIKSTLAGVSADDLEINVTRESVTIKGERRREEKISEKDYFYQECFWGTFSRSVILPQEIDPEHANASIKNGILTLKLPKLDKKKAKKLKVKFD